MTRRTESSLVSCLTALMTPKGTPSRTAEASARCATRAERGMRGGTLGPRRSRRASAVLEAAARYDEGFCRVAEPQPVTEPNTASRGRSNHALGPSLGFAGAAEDVGG